MRVLVVGGGGLGTVLAAFLSRGGAEVTLLVRPERVAAFERDKVRLTGLAEFAAPVHIAGAPPSGRFDYLVVSVKGQDTEAALDPLRHIQVDTVLSVQNGVLKDEVLARLFGPDTGRVLGAISGAGGALQAPGWALHSLRGATLVGELDGSTSPRGERFAALLTAGGLPSACVPEIRRIEWYKLAGFLRTAIVCSLTRLDVVSAALDPDIGRIGARIAGEVAAVAAAEGQPLWQLAPSLTFHGKSAPAAASEPYAWSEDELVAGIVAFGEAVRAQGVTLYPSLTQDTIAGGPTELEYTAGNVVTRAAHHGVPVPILDACTRLLRGQERLRLAGR